MLPQAVGCRESPEAGETRNADPKAFRESLASGHLDPRVPALRAMRGGEMLSLGLSPLQHNSGSAGSPEEG